MREKIAEILGWKSSLYKLGEADQILALISKEIEKVENPCVDAGKYKGLCWPEFEDCRQKILSLLGGKDES